MVGVITILICVFALDASVVEVIRCIVLRHEGSQQKTKSAAGTQDSVEENGLQERDIRDQEAAEQLMSSEKDADENQRDRVETPHF